MVGLFATRRPATASDAVEVLGDELARDGASLPEALVRLREDCRAERGADPTFAEILALASAWSETTLGYLHQLSCEDPLTGMATLAHLRARLSELYRSQRLASVRETSALVVVDLGAGAQPDPDPVSLTLLVTGVGQLVRSVFAEQGVLVRAHAHRVVLLTDRDERLGSRIALLRRMIGAAVEGRDVRVWIEGLPPADREAGSLLDELARR